ncbi:glycosyltransferase family 2 protein [Actinotalea solisilvae]|uniref:glycosyltransferase family 2 protein n=1 Tax=Actinotalea solisilvae TaxID=2072922 RepID=UPI0027DE1A43|nr:glycosyltransferase family 2 protein [Actinotalea solisilvae]
MTLTFRRPDDLRDALPALLEHVERLGGASASSDAARDVAELVVVDNDTVPSAREVVEAYAADRPVRYVHEPRPGIAAARNRGLDACAGSDLLVFVDDDERPREGWLAALLATFDRTRATGVVGPVVSVFDGPVDPWIAAGRFFDRLRHPTGTRVPVVATNNLLLDLAAVRALGVRFDERFGLSGGSDTVFSLEVGRRGGSFVWCDEAVVEDVVPPSRLTRRWVLRRAFRSGNSGTRAAVHVARSTGERLVARGRGGARGAVRALGGALQYLAGTLARSAARQARGARTAARGAGMVVGALGLTYAEYARPAEVASGEVDDAQAGAAPGGGAPVGARRGAAGTSGASSR